jgi:type IV pilus assembly protein PilX
MRRLQTPSRQRQRGVTIVITLILLAVMLLGGLAVARMSEVSTLAAGNTAWREGAVQASEVGVNTAFAALQALPSEDVDVASWYFASARTADAQGLPAGVNWASAPAVTVGQFEVRYVVDRQCFTLPMTDRVRQCLNRTRDDGRSTSASNSSDPPDPVVATQYRISVRVTGPKDTVSFVQVMANRN